MALGDIKTFTYDYGTLKLEVYAIDMGDGTIKFEIKSLLGSADINAIYWSDGDAIASEGTMSGFDAKKDSALNMNGTSEAWDGGLKLSSPGIGKEGLAKETYLQEGESVVRTVTLDWDSLDTFGIRATSTTTTGGSIKAVDGDAVIDLAPKVSIDDITVTEGVDPTATFTISIDSVYTYDVYVTYSTSGVDASSPGDFTAASGQVKIAAGQTSAQVVIHITDDLVSEPTEYFHVNLTGATLDIPGDDLTLPPANIEAYGIGTILDNDAKDPAPPPVDNDFPVWPQDISHIVLYFDQDAGDVKPKNDLDGYVTVKIDNVPGAANDDLDTWIDAALAYLVAQPGNNITANSDLVGVSIKGGNQQAETFYAYGDHNTNGDLPDTAPLDTNFPLPGNETDQTVPYAAIFGI